MIYFEGGLRLNFIDKFIFMDIIIKEEIENDF